MTEKKYPIDYRQTAGKAVAGSISGSLTTLALYWLSRFTEVVPAPEAGLVQDAAVSVVAAVVGALPGAVVYVWRNHITPIFDDDR